MLINKNKSISIRDKRYSNRIKAIKRGNFIGRPMLTVENVNKYFPESEETVKGHMSRQQQGVRSTKPKDFQEHNANSEIGKKERDVYIKL